MRITIGTKLIVGFMLIVLLMVALAVYSVSVSQKSLQQSVGKSSIFLAEEMLKRMNRDVYLKIEELQTHSKHLVLQKTLYESNREFERIDSIEKYINQKDREWVSAPKDEITPFMQELISNELSDTLRYEFTEFYEKKYGYKVLGEIIVTNKYGANVGQTGKTSDYRQDDEEWWQIAREKGFYVSDVVYDESAEMYVIGIGIRVDDEEEYFIGAILSVLNIKGIIRESEIATKKYETTRIKVITKDGRLIYKTKAFKFLEDVSEKGFFKKIKGENGFFVDRVGGRERLYSYAHSKGYRNFEGLQWILVVGHDTGEVLKLAFVSRNNMLIASLIVIAIGIFATFFFSRSITKPVTGVRDAAVEIAQGNLAKRIEVTSRDEIGQLAHAFNEMASKLEESYRGLEEKVRERTDELEKSNKELESEITERKRSEEALRLSEEELAMRNRIANIFLTAPDDEIYGEVLKVLLEIADSKYGVLGYIDENGDYVVPSMTRHIWDQCKVPDKNIVFHRETWGDSIWPRAIREKKMLYSNEPSALTPEGHIPILRNITMPIFYQGEVIGLFQVANKETDYDEKDIQLLEIIADHIAPILNVRLQRDRQEKARKQAEQERERLNAELARKNKELEQIVYVTSHDLRSPLVNVQGFSKELDYSLKELASAINSEGVPMDVRDKIASILEEEIPEAMQYIQASISKMDSLLSGLLRLSRLGRAAIKTKKLDMNNLIADVASTFEFQIKEADVTLTISELLPCKGDATQINQVFSNLLGNALKFLDPARPGIIRISGYKEKEQSVYCVEDNGIGIAHEHQEKMFEIFHKLEPAVDGQGLGLTIVSRILDRHTGNVWVESEPGKGSKFFVSLPNETNTL